MDEPVVVALGICFILIVMQGSVPDIAFKIVQFKILWIDT